MHGVQLSQLGGLANSRALGRREASSRFPGAAIKASLGPLEATPRDSIVEDKEVEAPICPVDAVARCSTAIRSPTTKGRADGQPIRLDTERHAEEGRKTNGRATVHRVRGERHRVEKRTAGGFRY